MDDIDSFVNFCRVSEYQFERFFRIPRHTIKTVRRGIRSMPAKYWHIFYERKIPTYGHENEPAVRNMVINKSGGELADVLADKNKVNDRPITPPVALHGRFAALK